MNPSWRRLEDAFVFVFRRRLQDVFIKTNIFVLALRLQKTSSRCLGQGQYIRPGHTSSRRLQNVFQTSCQGIFKRFSRPFQNVFQKRYQDIFKTSWRRFEDVFKTSSRRLANTSSRCLQDIFKTSCKYIFKTFSRCIIKLNCSY